MSCDLPIANVLPTANKVLGDSINGSVNFGLRVFPGSKLGDQIDAGEMVRRRDEPPFKRRCLL